MITQKSKDLEKTKTNEKKLSDLFLDKDIRLADDLEKYQICAYIVPISEGTEFRYKDDIVIVNQDMTASVTVYDCGGDGDSVIISFNSLERGSDIGEGNLGGITLGVKDYLNGNLDSEGLNAGSVIPYTSEDFIIISANLESMDFKVDKIKVCEDVDENGVISEIPTPESESFVQEIFVKIAKNPNIMKLLKNKKIPGEDRHDFIMNLYVETSFIVEEEMKMIGF